MVEAVGVSHLKSSTEDYLMICLRVIKALKSPVIQDQKLMTYTKESIVARSIEPETLQKVTTCRR